MMKRCKDIAELASRSLDEPLSFKDRLLLRLHLVICSCPICQKFLGQLRVSRTACQALAKRWEHETQVSAGEGLSTEARDRLIVALKSEK